MDLSTNLRRFGTLLWLVSILCIVLPAHGYSAVSNDTLRKLPRPGTDFDIHNGALLAPILRERVPGSEGSLAVLEHFVKFFNDTLPEWKVELQNSTSKTPVTGDKDVPFVNVIAYRDPPWATDGDVGRLTLAAHYDSKYTPHGFIGAIDSAAPCAIMMHSMRSIDAALTKKWDEAKADPHSDIFLDSQQGIQIIFTDGEEGFAGWTPTDSIYGARSLAESMETEIYPAMSTYKSPLAAISLFVLLDLLGSLDPKIPSYFKTTHWAYQNLAKLEARLRDLGEFKSSPSKRSRADSESGKQEDDLWLPDESKQSHEFRPSRIGDDHEPFMERGVDILHLIPSPFPDVWHNLGDNAENLDLKTVEDWSTLMTAFVAEWLELEGHFESKDSDKRWMKTELT